MFMDSLTILFLGGVLGLYLIQFFMDKNDPKAELKILTLLFGICSVCTILTDESLNTSEIGLLPLFPVIFVMLHTVLGLLWGTKR